MYNQLFFSFFFIFIFYHFPIYSIYPTFYQMGTDEDARDYAPEDIAAKKRDEKLSEMVESYNSKKRAEPLIDMHKKKKKVRDFKASGFLNYDFFMK